MVSNEEQKAEAIKRLKMLKIHPNVIKEFQYDKPLLNYSYRGILYWIDNEEWKEIISNFETKFNAVVYHAIFTPTGFGDLLTLLYVSEHVEEWAADNEELEHGYAYAYVANLTNDICSEIGRVCVEPRCGGVVRTA